MRNFFAKLRLHFLQYIKPRTNDWWFKNMNTRIGWTFTSLQLWYTCCHHTFYCGSNVLFLNPIATTIWCFYSGHCKILRTMCCPILISICLGHQGADHEISEMTHHIDFLTRNKVLYLSISLSLLTLITLCDKRKRFLAIAIDSVHFLNNNFILPWLTRGGWWILWVACGISLVAHFFKSITS